MPKKTKTTGKTRLDKFYRLAKEQGFRSRAAFKLIQLNKKFDFLSSCKVLVDLCAAPGGWLQAASKTMSTASLIIGVDLVPIRSIPRVHTLVEDITTASCRAELMKLIQQGGYGKNMVDVVLHDGSPNVGGAWSKDAFGQSELVLHSVRLAADMLRPGGSFITKVFRSRDYQALLWVCKQLFKWVHVTKPEASRSTSAEIYFVCRGFLAPKKIDPKMFNSKHVFSENESTKTGLNDPNLSIHTFWKMVQKQRRKRDGYEDGVMLLHKKTPVMSFLESHSPLALVAESNEFTLQEADPRILEHIDEELKFVFKDLKVIGKRELKLLMKWRKEMKELLREEKEVEETKKVEMTEEEREEHETQQLLTKLQEAKKRQESRIKRLKRKRREQRAKSREINSTIANNEDIELFNITKLESEESLNILHEGYGNIEEDSNDEADDEPESEDGEDTHDLDTEERRLIEIEQQMQELYENFKERRNILDKKKKRKLRELGLEESDVDEDDQSADEDQSDKDLDVFTGKKNPLENDLGMKTDETTMWFQRDLMQDAMNLDDVKDEGTSDVKAVPKVTFADNVKFGPSTEIEVDKSKACESDESDEEERRKSDELEEVPQDDFDDLSDDSDALAERLALGQAMLRKKNKEKIINDAYNRFNFDDSGCELPEWFIEDEEQNNRPILPVTKTEVDEMRERMKVINAKPIKKIVEARARRKMRAVKRWEKIKQQADSVATSTEMSNGEKMRRLERIYAKKNSKEKKKKVYVVSHRQGGTHSRKSTRGAWVVRVDKRLRADKKGLERAEKRKKKRQRRGR